MPRFLLHLVSHTAIAVLAASLWYITDRYVTDGYVVDRAVVQPWITSLAVVVSIITGITLSHLVHEWGHFVGARWSRSTYTLKKNISPLFFDFDYVGNNPHQYLWMSIGGPAGNMLLITLTTLLLPMDTPASLWLLATMFGQLVYVLVLEGPVSLGILAGKNPLDVLSQHFGQGAPLFRRSCFIGIIAGLLVVAILTL